MTYNEKKSLYESIMKEVAQIVKSSLNESYNSSIVRKLILMAKNASKNDPNNIYWLNVYNSNYNLNSTKFVKGDVVTDPAERIKLGDFDDDCFEGDILTGQEASALYYQSYNAGIYCNRSKFHIGETNPIVFAIKFSDKGMKKLDDIRNKIKNRSDNNKTNDESYKNKRRYALRLQQRFNKDNKKAEELGVSIEDYLGIKFYIEATMPHERKENERSSDRFKEYLFNQSYFEFLKTKGITLDKEHVKDTLIKLLSVLKNKID